MITKKTLYELGILIKTYPRMVPAAVRKVALLSSRTASNRSKQSNRCPFNNPLQGYDSGLEIKNSKQLKKKQNSKFPKNQKMLKKQSKIQGNPRIFGKKIVFLNIFLIFWKFRVLFFFRIVLKISKSESYPYNGILIHGGIAVVTA